jgi:hypothetical protein
MLTVSNLLYLFFCRIDFAANFADHNADPDGPARRVVYNTEQRTWIGAQRSSTQCHKRRVAACCRRVDRNGYLLDQRVEVVSSG